MKTLLESILSRGRTLNINSAMLAGIVDDYFESLAANSSLMSHDRDKISKMFSAGGTSLSCATFAPYYFTPTFLDTLASTYGVKTVKFTGNRSEATIMSPQPNGGTKIKDLSFDLRQKLFVSGGESFFSNKIEFDKCEFYSSFPSTRAFKVAILDFNSNASFTHCTFRDMVIAFDPVIIRKQANIFTSCQFDHCMLRFNFSRVKNNALPDFITGSTNSKTLDMSYRDILDLITGDSIIDNSSAVNHCDIVVDHCVLFDSKQYTVSISEKAPNTIVSPLIAVYLKDGALTVQ